MQWTRAGRLLSAFIVSMGILNGTPAEARWIKATTDNFELYSRGSDKSLRLFAIKLEKFRTVLTTLWPSEVASSHASERLPVYVVNGQRQLRKLIQEKNVYGFYTATPESIFAVVTKSDSTLLETDDVLFHEYAHHFMKQYFNAAYPPWFVEGFAEYVATAEISDSRITLGRYATGRALDLSYYTWIPFDQVIGKDASSFSTDDIPLFYAQSWLLTHYVMRDADRRVKLNEYMKAIANGESSWPAFSRIFAVDAKTLNKQLDGYWNGGDMTYTLIQGFKFPDISMGVEEMPASADDLLLPRLEVLTGNKEVLPEIEKEAGSYQGDVYAQETLALAEIYFGDPRKAIEALSRLGTPDDPTLLYLDGLARLGLVLEKAPDKDEMLHGARHSFSKSFKLDPDRYQTLYRYAESYFAVPGGGDAPDSVVDVLLRAYNLAPQVTEIGLNAARVLLDRKRADEAMVILSPIANDAHNPKAAAIARKLIRIAQSNTPVAESQFPPSNFFGEQEGPDSALEDGDQN